MLHFANNFGVIFRLGDPKVKRLTGEEPRCLLWGSLHAHIRHLGQLFRSDCRGKIPYFFRIFKIEIGCKQFNISNISAKTLFSMAFKSLPNESN